MKYYGVDYYPEQETSDDIKKDILLMKEAGFNVVRMGEFAWCRFEPAEGKYDFEWFDEITDMLGKNGIYSIVCTPTACPPIWLVEKHPEILYKDNRGVIRPFGGRRHYCYNNQVYRDFSKKIAGEIANRYGNNPYVLGFHIDNELAQESTGRCYCDVCKTKFHKWLEDKYRTIGNLNNKMGTIFWSQTYERFDQINLPLKPIEVGAEDPLRPHFDNPSLRLDFERFCSESMIEYQNIQTDIIKSFSGKPVTTNSTGIITNSLNYYESFSKLDVTGLDYYPPLRSNEAYTDSYVYSFSRGIKRKNFWILETSASGGHGVWDKQAKLQPYPGALKVNAVHAYASGADLLTYFQFRSFRFGAEHLQGCIINIDGIPDRRFEEFKTISKDVKRLKPILEDSEIKNEVAICHDYDTIWGINIKPFKKDFNYHGFSTQIYSTFVKAGIGVDVIPCSEIIKEYKFVIIPVPMIMSDEFKQTLKEFVKNGGTVLTTFLAAIKGVYNTAPRERVPAGLTDLFGVRVVEGEPVFEDSVARISINIDGVEYFCANKYWTESLETTDAQIIGRYADTYRKGEAVISKNVYGKGNAYYMGTFPEEELFEKLILEIAGNCGIERVPFSFGPGVEVIKRISNGLPVYFIFNFREQETTIEIAGKYIDLLDRNEISGTVLMEAKTFRVLKSF